MGLKRSHILILFLILFIRITPLFAQQLNIPLGTQFNLGWERIETNQDSLRMHTAVRPLMESSALTYSSAQAAHKTDVTKHFAWLFKDSNWLKRKSKWENFYSKKGSEFYFDINPLFNFEYGRDLANNNALKFFKNSRGILINGHLTDKFSFSTMVMENQMYVPTYLRNYAYGIGALRDIGTGFKFESPVMPGQGRVKVYSDQHFDFAYAQGYFTFAPHKNHRLQLGNGKLVVGDGYRSMLLSDNASSYPYLRYQGEYLKGKLQYSLVYAALLNMVRHKYYSTPEPIFERKAAVFYHLNWMVSKKLNIGFFEGDVWRRTSDEQVYQKLDPTYFMPVPLVNVLRFGMRDSAVNTLLGLNFKYLIRKQLYAYGQLACDDPSDGKFAYQIGAKWFDAFGWKHFYLQGEINHAARYMYAADNGRINYGHYNQSLAHPSGAGFFEAMLFGHYRNDDFFYSARIIYQTFRQYDVSNQWGKDIYLPASAGDGSGEASSMAQLFYKDIQFGYIINPLYNMQLMIGWFHRDLRHVSDPYKTSYLYIGFRTNLSNFYYDL